MSIDSMESSLMLAGSQNDLARCVSSVLSEIDHAAGLLQVMRHTASIVAHQAVSDVPNSQPGPRST
jgi:hypothetical protein